MKHILIVGAGINDLDSSGEEVLSNLVNKAQMEDCGISFCGIKGPVRDVMGRSGLMEKIGAENIYARTYDAVEKLFYQTHEGGEADIKNCPLMTYLPEDENK